MGEGRADLHEDWRVEGDALVRDLILDDFAAGLAFVNRVGEAAEAANHHPDVHLHSYNRVRLKLSTHSEGRVTEKDHALAAQIDALAP
jgi:4a-hydroxytetrahydrobiopterin dehydratase